MQSRFQLHWIVEQEYAGSLLKEFLKTKKYPGLP